MTIRSSLGHLPGERWEFDTSVTAVFDDMLARSIPQYEVMRTLAYDVAKPFVVKGTYIVDLGCSRGESLAPFVRDFGATNIFLGVETSEPMIVAARDRFQTDIGANYVDIQRLDLREGYPSVVASVTLSVLTLMFTPINYRQRIVQDIYDHTIKGGTFVLVEKVIGTGARLDRLMVDRYHALKHDQGYSWEEIDRKRFALEGVQVPVTANWNVELLRQAGFREIDCFWRWCNFAGWIAIK